ncbi:MAG: bioCD, partial [Rhodospirillaceae bacterium]
LMARLGLPVVLVARSRLGTINHTLLSLAALRNRGLTVLGVVMNGPSNPPNCTALEDYGRIPVKELPHVDHLDSVAVASLTRVFKDAVMAVRCR